SRSALSIGWPAPEAPGSPLRREIPRRPAQGREIRKLTGDLVKPRLVCGLQPRASHVDTSQLPRRQAEPGAVQLLRVNLPRPLIARREPPDARREGPLYGQLELSKS